MGANSSKRRGRRGRPPHDDLLTPAEFSDIEAAQRWYGEVVRLPHLYTFGKLAFFNCGGTRLFLEEGGRDRSP